MTGRLEGRGWWIMPFGLAVLGTAGVAAVGTGSASRTVAAALVAFPMLFLVWWAEPAWVITAGILLSPISGNWPRLGIPGAVAPDRLLLVAGILSVFLRAIAAGERPRLRLGLPHALLGLMVLYAIGSALVAGTLSDHAAFFLLVDNVGIIPLLLLAIAPAAFPTERERTVLLVGLVLLGAYLGLTAIFETVGLNALVFPSYITDPSFGIHYGRARGPFVEAATNGTGMFVCLIAAVMGAVRWRRWARAGAALVIALSIVGILMTLTREVWLGAIVASLLTGLTVPRLRRLLVPVTTLVVVLIGLAIGLVPGLAGQVTNRTHDQGTVWDRQNLYRAAWNMTQARPVLGFGWHTFLTKGDDYFQQAATYPLPVGPEIIHNAYLTYSAELGLLGLTLWLGAVLSLVIGGVVSLRGPPRASPWRAGFLAYATFYLVLALFVYPQVFPNLMLWLWGGLVWGLRDEAISSAPVAEGGRIGPLVGGRLAGEPAG